MTSISVGLNAKKGAYIHDYITYIILHRYIHTYVHIFNFDQSSEYIGIGYEACHKINLIESNQQSLSHSINQLPMSTNMVKNLIHKNNTILKNSKKI
jgi:hypothetical protein